MRTEDIVGVSFFLVVFIGIGQIIYGSRRPKGTGQAHWWQGAGLMVMGLAFLR